ncbi:MAG: hypothetical protein KBA26_13025, partial [Candidatus Delongbacteria bacterium]|nr:hypothetical protein [Candidatus Delongbacteria bacterium]
QNLTFFSMEHGRYPSAHHLRSLMLKNSYDALALDAAPSWKLPLTEALCLLPAPSMIVKGEHYWLVEPVEVTVEGLRLANYLKIPVHFFRSETDIPAAEPGSIIAAPDSLQSQAKNALYHSLFLEPSRAGRQDPSHAWYAAGLLNRLNETFRNVMVLIEPDHLQSVLTALPHGGEWVEWKKQSPAARIIPIHSEYYIGLTGEFPLLSALYEKHRSRLLDDDILYPIVLSEFNRFLVDQLHQTPLGYSLLRSILQYAYRLAYRDNQSRPGLYHLLKSVRGMAHDELALQFLKLSWTCPYLYSQDSPMIAGEYEELFQAIARQEIKNYFSYPARVSRSLKFNLLPPKPLRQKWAAGLDSGHQVSYQPEDVVIENFRHHVFTNSFEFSSIHQARVEEFRGSMKDGPAFRETIRKFYTHKLYVREERIHPGKIGAMVVIFDMHTDHYPLQATWYAEHPYESTLCFYAGDPTRDMVGPGIGRACYGGLLMLYPPQWILDIWHDPFFAHYPSPIDRLVLSALVYSREKFIVYLAGTPPPDHYRHWAHHYRKGLVYVPLSEFSRQQINKLRVFHVLYHKKVRTYADRFIH